MGGRVESPLTAMRRSSMATSVTYAVSTRLSSSIAVTRIRPKVSREEEGPETVVEVVKVREWRKRRRWKGSWGCVLVVHRREQRAPEEKHHQSRARQEREQDQQAPRALAHVRVAHQHGVGRGVDLRLLGPAGPLRGGAGDDPYVPGLVRAVLDDRDAARAVGGEVDQVDVLGDLHAVGRPGVLRVRGHGEPELDRYVGRFAARRPQVLDPGQGEPADRWFPARRASLAAEDGEQDQEGQDPAPGGEDRHVLQDDPDRDGRQRRTGHAGRGGQTEDRQAAGGWAGRRVYGRVPGQVAGRAFGRVPGRVSWRMASRVPGRMVRRVSG